MSDYSLTILNTPPKNKILDNFTIGSLHLKSSFVLEILDYLNIKSSRFRLIYYIIINPTKDRSMKALIAKC